MTYINLPNQQLDPNVRENIIYSNGQFCFQRVTQIDDNKFEFVNAPLNGNFTGAVRKALFPNQANSYVPDAEDSSSDQTIVEHYIVDRADPPRMNSLSDEEAFTDLRIHDDGSLEITIYTSEDDGINYLMDHEMLKNVHQLINDTCEDLKRQTMLSTSETESGDCANQTAGKPFKCCGKCEVCHCG